MVRFAGGAGSANVIRSRRPLFVALLPDIQVGLRRCASNPTYFSQTKIELRPN